MRIKRMLFSAALATLVAVPATTTLTPGIGSAHHPLVTAEASECIRPDATTWVVDLWVTSDDPSRGKEYSVVSLDYQPAGWVNESIPFIRTVVVPIAQTSYTETVLVSWRSGDDYGPTQISGTATVNRPPTCPQEPSFMHLVFCEEAGGVNGPVALVGTANGEPISFGAGESLFFPYDDAGELHLVLMDGDTKVFDQVLSAPEGIGCDFSAAFVGAADCDDIVTGTLTVNPDGYQASLYYRVNGGEWVAMTGNTADITGMLPFTTVEVGDGESVMASATIEVALPDECTSPPAPEANPSAKFTPPTCSADGSLTLNNAGTAPAKFTITYLSMPAGVASGFEVTLAPGETRVVPLNVELGRFSLVVQSGGKTLVDGLLARPAVCAAPQLPATGVATWQALIIGTTLLTTGALLLWLRGRRRLSV